PPLPVPVASRYTSGSRFDRSSPISTRVPGERAPHTCATTVAAPVYGGRVNTAVWARDREAAATDMAEGPFTRSSLSGRRVHVDRSGELTEGDSDGLPHTAVAHGLVE